MDESSFVCAIGYGSSPRGRFRILNLDTMVCMDKGCLLYERIPLSRRQNGSCVIAIGCLRTPGKLG